ncbi:D-alanyl-D-alanine carboxypeptidase/D-alanyl-D-alanine endopeptidase [Gracilimonas mengyeensis]|uniref:D-alanyl-D-alanine carboxypeptidase / D-alanyl-D-alanine-endopeptidase (Penicillin-binding protein 4) n=1 Tax=Gracilimonas mengyeensis TaxID=1302730 RepID=A0A521AAK5_9BACT|nr:D-alanyl-D-alanine carboxypeptidase/D-alanyl-D-alanine-endopeptidase [Gracilimonas mengyeensis]SMO31859.1 D-alanyl-D-alanine carboxypeptidase / D-alanyl-D-alanine-endopeptidase (penicillin-binding protein 4) [Gracilimonas mengyeensis]
MSKAIRILFLFLFVFAAESLCAQSLSSIIKKAPNQEAFWSVTVRDENGGILESYHPKKAIIPASNQKLVTSAALLDYFGSDFKFVTNIYGDGSQQGATWMGDLIIKGSGDPSISGDLYDGDRYHVFEVFLEQLQDQGIERVEGDLLADVSLFDTQYYPKGWDWYDMSFYYGVQVSPLSFNNNAVDLDVYAEGNIGDTPRISWFPENTDYVTFVNEQVITHPATEYDEYYRREMGGNTIVLGSTLPQGYHEEEALSVNNPALFFLDSFKKYLLRNGISVTGDIEILPAEASYDTSMVLAQHHSKPLGKLIEWLNKESDNFYTEMLVKKLSAQSGTQPGTFEDGIKLVRVFLDGLGIDTTYVQMNDGSGMAAGNFNQTSILSGLLQNMQDHPEFDSYFSSMSIAGIDGTLAHRMKGTPLYQNFRGKSGFVTGVRTLSGYMEAKSGKKLIVSLATNSFISEKVRPIDAVHEEILMYLYEKY